MFQKKKQLNFTSDTFEMPNLELFYKNPLWTVPNMEAIKHELNVVKTKLNDLPLGPWHEHTRRSNTGNLILPVLRNGFRPEFCTWAWGKMTEILQSYDVIPKVYFDLNREGCSSQISSLHLCEAPGAFVSATNHFLKMFLHNLDWNWTATSFNPYYEGNSTSFMINNDRLILSSASNWDFLKDGTGNIMIRENIEALRDKMTNRKNVGVAFVTADGSIDCQVNPENQEGLLTQLHLAEIVAALEVLDKGGSFIMKIFTFFECQTISHLYFLSCVFNETHLFKPICSREGNSEVYVICLGFGGNQKYKHELEILMAHVEKRPENSLFPIEAIDSTFLNRLEDAAKYFAEFQISVIHRNLESFPPPPNLYSNYREVQNEVVERFLDIIQLRPLHVSERIFPNEVSALDPKVAIASLHVDTPEASHFETTTMKLGRISVLRNFIEQLEDINQRLGLGLPNSVRNYFGTTLQPFQHNINIIRGKPYTELHSSRFCYSSLLSLRQELRGILIGSRALFNDFLEKSSQVHRCQYNMLSVISRVSTLCHINLRWLHNPLKAICFHESFKTFVLKNDFYITQKRISTLLEKILEDLNHGETLYLCEYPLFTRLHVGLLFIFTKIFSKVSFVASKDDLIFGVVLFRFLGFTNLTLMKLRDDLAVVRDELTLGSTNEPPVQTILEIVDIQYLCATDRFPNFLEYNRFNITLNMQDYISTAKLEYETRQMKEQQKA